MLLSCLLRQASPYFSPVRLLGITPSPQTYLKMSNRVLLIVDSAVQAVGWLWVLLFRRSILLDTPTPIPPGFALPAPEGFRARLRVEMSC